MKCSTAVQLLGGMLEVFQRLPDGDDKTRMAEAAVALREVLPDLLDDSEDRGGFLDFVDKARQPLSAADYYKLDKKLPA
ncbi:hypothetical protein IP92_05499 [Pseudoduganella flava]|nr:hypothetical protein IP92_05499 [Pseudoduganella flava]